MDSDKWAILQVRIGIILSVHGLPVSGSSGEAMCTNTPHSSLPHDVMLTCEPSPANHRPFGSANTTPMPAQSIAIDANILRSIEDDIFCSTRSPPCISQAALAAICSRFGFPLRCGERYHLHAMPSSEVKRSPHYDGVVAVGDPKPTLVAAIAAASSVVKTQLQLHGIDNLLRLQRRF